MLQPVVLVKEKDGETVKEPTSKKPAPARRADLLAKILPQLLQSVMERAEALIIDKAAYVLLLEVVLEAYRVSHTAYPTEEEEKDTVQAGTVNTLQNTRGPAIAAIDAIAAAAANDLSILATWSGHLMLKRLLLHSVPSGEECSGIVYKHLENHIAEIVQDNRGAFLINALLESAGEDTKQQLTVTLNKLSDTLTMDKPGHLALGKHLKVTKTTKTPKKANGKANGKKVEKKEALREEEEEEERVPKKTPKTDKKRRKQSIEDEEEKVNTKVPSPAVTRARKKKIAGK